MSDELRCPKCDNPMEEGAVFCQNCGFKASKSKHKPRKSIIIACVPFIIMLLVCAIVVSNAIFIPSVVGKTREEATVLLAKKGLRVEFITDLTDNIEENTVYRQNLSGIHLLANDIEPIVLYVSEGIAVDCPLVEGMSEQQALQALDSFGLKYSITRQYTTNFEKGVVFQQDQKGKVKSGAVVALSISKGIGKVVTDQIGASPQQAAEELGAAGFNVVINEYADGADIFSEDPVVISQDKTGIQPFGDTVTLEVDRPSIQIPTIHTTSNSINGIDLEITLKNVSDKEIKYVDLEISFYNPFGEPAPCEITGENTYSARYVGPLYPNASQRITTTRPVLYNPNVAAWRLTSIVVTFIDDTTQELTSSEFWHTNKYVGDGTFY